MPNQQNQGWVCLWRKLKDNPIYTNSVAVHCWIECLLRASHNTSLFYSKRTKVKLKSGQFLMGREEFGNTIGISPSTAWYWIQRFKADSMVNIKSDPKGTTITILNWGEHQQFDNTLDSKKTANEQQSRQQMNTNNNVNNISKDIEKPKKEKEQIQIKKKYGDPDINFLIEYLPKELNLPKLDGTQKENRRYANLSLKKFEGLDHVKMVVDAAARNDFWKNSLTSFKMLYYNGYKIMNSDRKDVKAEGGVNL